MSGDRPLNPMSAEDAGKVLSALRIAHGMLHPDDASPVQRQWYAEVSEAMAIQESFLATIQKRVAR